MNFLKYSIRRHDRTSTDLPDPQKAASRRQPKNTNAKEDGHQSRGVDKLRKQAAAASMTGSTALCDYAAVAMSTFVVDAGATPTAMLDRSAVDAATETAGVFGTDAGRRRSLGWFSHGPASKVPNAQPSQPTASASTSRASPARQTHTTPACETRSDPSRWASTPENGPRHAPSDSAGSLLLRLTCLAADSNVRSCRWSLPFRDEPEAGFHDAIERLLFFIDLSSVFV